MQIALEQSLWSPGEKPLGRQCLPPASRHCSSNSQPVHRSLDAKSCPRHGCLPWPHSGVLAGRNLSSQGPRGPPARGSLHRFWLRTHAGPAHQESLGPCRLRASGSAPLVTGRRRVPSPPVAVSPALATTGGRTLSSRGLVRGNRCCPDGALASRSAGYAPPAWAASDSVRVTQEPTICAWRHLAEAEAASRWPSRP